MFDPFIEACELRDLMARGELRPREVVDVFLRRIEELNPILNAFMTVTAERALADVAQLVNLDPRSLPLFGVPYSIKDLTWTKGIRTTFGSRNYANFVPPADAEFVVRLHRAGGILLGKTTTPEYGGRPTTEGGLCPPARNPWNREHTAGGSSGGAAAQVAMGLSPLARSALGPVDTETLAVFESACQAFTDMGHRIEPVDIDPAAQLVDAFGVVVGANLAAVHFEDDDLIDPMVRVFVDAGRRITAGEYVTAMARDLRQEGEWRCQCFLLGDAHVARFVMSVQLPRSFHGFVTVAIANGPVGVRFVLSCTSLNLH